MAWLVNWNNKQSFQAKLKWTNETIFLSLLDNYFHLLQIPFISVLVVGTESKVLLCPTNEWVIQSATWLRPLVLFVWPTAATTIVFVPLTSTIPTTNYNLLLALTAARSHWSGLVCRQFGLRSSSNQAWYLSSAGHRVWTIWEVISCPEQIWDKIGSHGLQIQGLLKWLCSSLTVYVPSLFFPPALFSPQKFPSKLGSSSLIRGCRQKWVTARVGGRSRVCGDSAAAWSILVTIGHHAPSTSSPFSPASW